MPGSKNSLTRVGAGKGLMVAACGRTVEDFLLRNSFR